jgi:hypothetical protein
VWAVAGWSRADDTTPRARIAEEMLLNFVAAVGDLAPGIWRIGVGTAPVGEGRITRPCGRPRKSASVRGPR